MEIERGSHSLFPRKLAKLRAKGVLYIQLLMGHYAHNYWLEVHLCIIILRHELVVHFDTKLGLKIIIYINYEFFFHLMVEPANWVHWKIFIISFAQSIYTQAIGELKGMRRVINDIYICQIFILRLFHNIINVAVSTNC
jgi:hypothetical protein